METKLELELLRCKVSNIQALRRTSPVREPFIPPELVIVCAFKLSKVTHTCGYSPTSQWCGGWRVAGLTPPPPLRNGFWIAERKMHVQSFDPQVRKKTLSKFLGNNLTCCHLLISKSYTFEIACGTLFTKQSGRLWRQTTDFGRFQSYKWWRSSPVTPGEKSQPFPYTMCVFQQQNVWEFCSYGD